MSSAKNAEMMIFMLNLSFSRLGRKHDGSCGQHENGTFAVTCAPAAGWIADAHVNNGARFCLRLL
jgi:hypothetical protein